MTAPHSSQPKSNVLISPKGSTMSDITDISLIDEFPAGRDVIRVRITQMGSKEFADVRRFFDDGDDWAPSRKGIMLSLDQARSTLNALQQAVRFLERER